MLWLQDGGSLLSVVCSIAFWVMTCGQLAADWCLYLLTTAMPMYLHDVLHVSRNNYLVNVVNVVH